MCFRSPRETNGVPFETVRARALEALEEHCTPYRSVARIRYQGRWRPIMAWKEEVRSSILGCGVTRLP